MKKELLHNPDWLRQKYTIEGLSARAIARGMGASQATVQKWLRRSGIRVRSISESLSPVSDHVKLSDRQWLEAEYIDHGAKEIAKDLGVSYTTVVRRLRNFGIPVRGLVERSYLGRGEALGKLRDGEWLRQQYIGKRRASTDIAKELRVSYQTVVFWLRKHRMSVRSAVCCKYAGREGALERLADVEWLRLEYVENARTAFEMATDLGVDINTVIRWLEKAGITVRSNQESHYRGNNEALERLLDKDWLLVQYSEELKTAERIGAEIGVCHKTVIKWLKRYGIAARTPFDYDITSSVHKHQLIPLLESLGVEHETSHVLDFTTRKGKFQYEIDEYLPGHKVFLELQGMYWHGYGNLNGGVAKTVRKDISKWRNLTREFPDHRVLYILESDLSGGLAERILRRELGFHADSTSLAERWKSHHEVIQDPVDVTPAKELLAEHHYLGTLSPNNYLFLSVDKNTGEPVAVATFSAPSRQEQKNKYGPNTLEFSRFCSTEHGNNHNSWFVAQCLRRIPERPIVTYADITRHPGFMPHNGGLYRACNFKEVGVTGTNYRYLRPDGTLLHKRAVWGRAKKNGVIERTQARNEDLVRFPEWPKRVFVYG